MMQFFLAHLFSIVASYLLLLGASYFTSRALPHKRLGKIAKGLFNSLLLLIPWALAKFQAYRRELSHFE